MFKSHVTIILFYKPQEESLSYNACSYTRMLFECDFSSDYKDWILYDPNGTPTFGLEIFALHLPRLSLKIFGEFKTLHSLTHLLLRIFSDDRFTKKPSLL